MNSTNPNLLRHPAVKDIQITSDGHILRGRLFRPVGRAKAAVIIHGATGVPQSYYRNFAFWLASEQNLAVMTYDYRDFGASSVTHPRRSKASLVDWAVQDQQAARLHLERLLPDVPIWVIGHSIGGCAMPFHRASDRIERVITIAAGPVHLHDHPWHYQFTARALWYALGPLSTAIAGYLPGGLLGFGQNLPAAVFWQWRRWCTTPGFMLPDVGNTLGQPDFDHVNVPLKVVAIADDAMVPPSAVWRLMQLYPKARKRQLTIDPASYGLKKIGHIAAFAKRNDAIWPDLIA